MDNTLVKITKNQNGFYNWTCSIDGEYYRRNMWLGIKACLGIAVFVLVFGGFLSFQRRNMWLGIKACLGIAVFVLVFGGFLSFQNNDWKSLLIVAGCDAVFLLITFAVFKLALLDQNPTESYEMTDIYIKSGYGKSSVYFDYDKARGAVITPKFIELHRGIKKMRVYIPAEDYEFVKGYIMSRLTGECEISYHNA